MKTHSTPFSAKRRGRVRALAFGAALAMVCAPAFAAETWIACEGTVVTKKGKEAGTSAAASDIYAYNDDVKALYKYAPNRKSLDLVATTTYDAKQILWQNPGRGVGSQSVQWEGKIDRGKMALSLVRQDGDEVMTWTQQCKPTSAQPTS